MDYTFRFEFKLRAPVRIGSQDSQWVLAGGTDESVRLGSLPRNVPFRDSDSFVTVGSGYSSENEAARAAQRWIAIFQAAFVCSGISADFKNRQFDVSDLSPGVAVYPTESPPLVFAGEPTGVSVLRGEKVREDILAVERDVLEPHPDQWQLAYDIFSASLAQTGDGQLVGLVTAVETLMSRESRSSETVAHIDWLIKVTSWSNLPQEEIDSLAGGLRTLKQESVGRVGRRISGVLGDRLYNGQEPSKFFTSCYEMRSKLVHGSSERPDRSTVGMMTAHLSSFVRDLLMISLNENWFGS